MADKPTYEELEQRVKELEKDVSERKHAEKAFRKEAGRLAALVDSIPDFVYFKDTQGRHLLVNKASAELMGLGKEKILGKTAKQLLPPDLAEQCLRSDQETIRRRERIHIEEQMTDDKGNKLFLETIKFPILDDQGNFKGLGGISRKISKRKQAEETLKQKNLELNSFINNIPDMAWVKDTDSRFIAVNRAFSEAVGMEPEYLINHTCEVCFGEEMAEKFRNDDLKVMESGKQEIIEEKIIDPGKKEIWLETIKSPILNESGKATGTVGVARNITRRKQAEDALQKAHDELEVRVKKRTAELVKKNEQLKQEVEERKQIEKALRESNETVKALLNATTDFVFLVDAEGTVRMMNKGGVKRLDRSLDEIIGRCIWDFLPTDVAESRKAIAEEVFNSGKHVRFNDQREDMYLDNIIYPLFDAKGQVEKIAVFARDITEQKRKEETLYESEEKYKTLAESSLTGVFIHQDGRFVF